MNTEAAPRSSGGRPAARAAASGDSGSGNLASSWVWVTPERRRMTARSPVGPGGSPVWAGLTAATAGGQRGDGRGDHGLADLGAGAADDEDRRQDRPGSRP